MRLPPFAVMFVTLTVWAGLFAMLPQSLSAVSSLAFAVFDAPSAGSGPGQGTTPWAINGKGEIAGVFIDNMGVPHGFLRSSSGSFVSFDAPNASQRADGGTTPRSINEPGDVAGYFSATTGTNRGFLRRNDGSFAIFDPLGSAGTVINSMNAQGEVTGNYVVNDQAHGLLGHKDGSFVTFDPPGGFNTAPEWIADNGDIAGYYEDQLGVLHGFIRHKDGTFAVTDVPSAVASQGKGTFPMSISENGELIGHYTAGEHGADRGFIRHKEGAIENIEPPGSITDDAVHADPEGYVLHAITDPLSINSNGEIAGYFDDTNGLVHGFVRRAAGNFEIVEVPGASTGSGLGTFPTSINHRGEVTGYYYTGSVGVVHGFVMTPHLGSNSAPRKASAKKK
ncbi:MAG TPA: hypothetical protein VG322_16730 [Candidatus Acidoferrales bacterium]|nr:hypothetical protein [Candidatus Acidoferrales bacterium]